LLSPWGRICSMGITDKGPFAIGEEARDGDSALEWL
jgi:hypothetical protein